MRVVLAPGTTGPLSAAQAAEAIAAGWARAAPGDRLVAVPLSTGGPGFLDAVAAATGGDLLAVTVAGPLGEEVPGTVLVAGATAYVEAAQAAGAHLLPPGRDPGEGSSYGVGQLLAAALGTGARQVVVGVGAGAVPDAGAGLLAALGAQPAQALRGGGRALAQVREVDLEAARRRLEGVELVAATDVDTTLAGGHAHGDEDLRAFAALAGPGLAARPGAGAGGGLGLGLLLLGATRAHGLSLVMELAGFRGLLPGAGLVLSGCTVFDWAALRTSVVAGVAKVSGEAGVPVVVLAGHLEAGRREMANAGVEAAYAMADTAAGARAALTRPGESLADLAERVARTWSRF